MSPINLFASFPTLRIISQDMGEEVTGGVCPTSTSFVAGLPSLRYLGLPRSDASNEEGVGGWETNVEESIRWSYSIPSFPLLMEPIVVAVGSI